MNTTDANKNELSITQSTFKVGKNGHVLRATVVVTTIMTEAQNAPLVMELEKKDTNQRTIMYQSDTPDGKRRIEFNCPNCNYQKTILVNSASWDTTCNCHQCHKELKLTLFAVKIKE